MTDVFHSEKTVTVDVYDNPNHPETVWDFGYFTLLGGDYPIRKVDNMFLSKITSEETYTGTESLEEYHERTEEHTIFEFDFSHFIETESLEIATHVSNGENLYIIEEYTVIDYYGEGEEYIVLRINDRYSNKITVKKEKVKTEWNNYKKIY